MIFLTENLFLVRKKLEWRNQRSIQNPDKHIRCGIFLSCLKYLHLEKLGKGVASFT